MFVWKKEKGHGAGDDGSQNNMDDPEVSLESWPARTTLALLEFSGICTGGEIERQSNSLKKALAADEASSWKIVDEEDLIVLQYNAPGTLPWRRKNQVAFVVEKSVPLEASKNADVPSNTTKSDEIENDDGDGTFLLHLNNGSNL